jgi:hypothetical protein
MQGIRVQHIETNALLNIENRQMDQKTQIPCYLPCSQGIREKEWGDCAVVPIRA